MSRMNVTHNGMTWAVSEADLLVLLRWMRRAA